MHRILPILLAVLVSVAMAGWLLLTPPEKPPPSEDGGTHAAQAAGTGFTPRAGLVDDERIRRAAADDAGAWIAYGRTYQQHRHASLTAINRETVTDLGIAWVKPLDTIHRLQATPLVVDGVMYVTDPMSIVYALDAATGEELWRFDPEIRGQFVRFSCCGGPMNRGVAVYGGRVFIGTFDARLVAIDAATGTKLWDVDTNYAPHEFSYTISGAPLVAAGKVYIGNSSSEFGGATTAGHRGYLSAYDAETGTLAWRFFTVPGNPAEPFEHPELELAASTWKGEWWKMGGGGTVWNSIVYDPELHTVYIGTGNGAPWPRAIRSPGGGDNLFLSSIVAVDPDTGVMKWYYQTTPGDNWDFAATQHIVLDELEIGGERRKVLMQAPKNGFFYVLDRESGELLNAFAFGALNWATHVDLDTGRPVEDPATAYEEKPQWILPGNSGAHTWHPMSWDAARRLVFVPTQELSLFYALPREFTETGVYKARFNTWNLGIERGPRVAELIAASDDPEGPPQQGFLKAFDPVTGELRWSVRNTVPYNGGLLSTAAGLVFQGDGAGVLTAYDSDTGESLWRLDAHGAIGAPPVTYEIDGEQYIAVLVDAHWRYQTTGRIVALKLGGPPSVPEPPLRDRSLPPPPPLTASAEEVAEGDRLYHLYCSACHGGQARSGLIADLRRMDGATHDAFLAIVLGGLRQDRGMARFDDVLDATGARRIHDYVIARANEDWTEQEQAEES